MHAVGSLMSLDSADLADARAAVGDARRLAAQLDSATSKVTELQKNAAVAASRVGDLLTQQSAALTTADAQVRTLVRERQAAIAAAQAAAFRTALVDSGAELTAGTTPPNALAAGAIAAARSRLGDPYVWGATGPSSFDCSGLTQWSYAHVGIQLPRVAADQWNAGTHIPIDQLLPGDLLFWATDVRSPVTIHHVAIYIGDGMMLAAPHTGDVVKIQPVYMNGYIGATRPYPTEP
jgi:cell wall-associated NlpC family hydrolase